MSQLKNVRRKFADNREWPDCKSRSSQGVEKKTVLQNKKMESFGGPPVKEVGT